MLYSIVFVILILFMMTLKKYKIKDHDNLSLYAWFSFIILALMSACRYQDFGSDFFRNYRHAIEAHNSSWANVLSVDTELLHSIFRKLIVTIFPDPQAYFFVTAIIITAIAVFTIKKYSNDLYLGIILFYAVFGYFSANNLTRQYLAISLTLLSWKYIIGRNPIKYSICMLCAVSFHLSAMVFIPLYILSSRKFSKNFLYAYLVLSVPAIVFRSQIIRLGQRFLYEEYGSGGYGSESSNPLRLVWVLVCIFALWLLNTKMKREDGLIPKDYDNKDAFYFHNLICHGTVLYCFFSVLSALDMLMFSRVAAYFGQCALIALTNSPVNAPNQGNKKMVWIIIFLVAVAWFIAMNYAGKLIPTPYIPFWQVPQRPRI